MDSGLIVSTCQWLSDLPPLEVPGHIGKLAFNATKNSQALSPVCFTPTGRPRVPAPPQKDTASAEGTQRQSRDQLAPAEAYGGPALPHHRELRVPSGHMHVALGVRRVVARDHAGRAVVVHRGRGGALGYSKLDLRPTGPRKLTRLAWPRDAAVATGAIARPPPRLNYAEESFRVLGRPFSGCPGNGAHRVALGGPRGSVSPPVGARPSTVPPYYSLSGRPEPLLPQRPAPPCPRFQWTEIMLWAAGRRFAADTGMRSLLSTITDSQPHQALLLGHRLSIRALIAWYFS